MPQTEYRFDKIHTGDNHIHRSGEPPRRVAPTLRLWVGKNQKLVDIPLTEDRLTDIIQQAARCIEALRMEATRDALRATAQDAQ